jgi:hypothetical protein
LWLVSQYGTHLLFCLSWFQENEISSRISDFLSKIGLRLSETFESPEHLSFSNSKMTQATPSSDSVWSWHDPAFRVKPWNRASFLNFLSKICKWCVLLS